MIGGALPLAHGRGVALQRKYYIPGTASLGSQANLQLQEGIGQVLVIQNFTFETARADRVGIYYFQPNDPVKLYRRIDAKQMLWDSTKRAWHLIDAVERKFTDDSSKESFTVVSDSASWMKLSFTPTE